MGGNMVVSPGEPTILASVGQFPLLREFRERSPRPSNAEHTAELLALAARAAWVRGDAAALTRAGRRLFRLAGAGALARRVLARALPATLGQLTSSAVALGRWSTATDHAAEGLAMARIGGQAMEAAGMLAQLAWIAAARGQAAECDRLAAEALAITAPRGFALVTATVTWALGLLDLSLGHPARALDRLAPLASSSGSTPVLLLATADLVEAAVRAGPPAAVQHARSRTPAPSSTMARGCCGSGAGARPPPACGRLWRPSSGWAPRPGPSGRGWSCWPAVLPCRGQRVIGRGRMTVVPAPIGGVASGRRRGDAAELQGAGQCPPRRHSSLYVRLGGAPIGYPLRGEERGSG